MVEGELWFKRAHFFTVRRSFRLRISAETWQVASYKETKAEWWKLERSHGKGQEYRVKKAG